MDCGRYAFAADVKFSTDIHQTFPPGHKKTARSFERAVKSRSSSPYWVEEEVVNFFSVQLFAIQPRVGPLSFKSSS